MTYLERQKSYGPDKLRREDAEEEKIRLKQYVFLRSKGRHNNPADSPPPPPPYQSNHSPSTYLQNVEGGQYLVEVVQPLTLSSLDFNLLKTVSIW